MDAVEFIKEYGRILKKYCPSESGLCPNECPLYQQACNLDKTHIDYIIFQQLVKTVEQWSKTHPQKTIMQDFFEKFPNAPKTDVGTPRMCPCDCGYEEVSYCPNNKMCDSLTCWNRSME